MNDNTFKHIDQAIYEMPDMQVVRRRKSLLPAFLLLVIGAAMITLCMTSPGVTANANLHASLLVCGWVLVLVGGIILLVRLFGKGSVPYNLTGREKLKRKEFYFETGKLPEVKDCLRRGDLEALGRIPRITTPVAVLVVYRGVTSGSLMCQPLEYIPHEYVPVAEMAIFKPEEVKVSSVWF